MENLFKYFQNRLSGISTQFIRYLYDQIEWNDRLIGITGARGTGKTTLMLQQIKMTFGYSKEVLYVSMDDFYFTNHRLFDLAEQFNLHGGKYLFIDEVHKYPLWDIDIKNIYDNFPELNLVFSGSSALQLQTAKVDLSRRAAMYHLHELSFREYLNLSGILEYNAIPLNEILINHEKIALDLIKKIKIIPVFKKYLRSGVYPFFIEVKGQFYDRLINTVNVIIESDLPATKHITYTTANKLKKVVSVIADSVPFKVNISELSRKTNFSRDILLRLLHSIEQANLITMIKQKGAPTSHLTKPDKIYLNNTALLYALHSANKPDTGTIRETFFMNQVSIKHKINTVPKGDFLIDNKFLFEIGGKNKTKTQIAGIEYSHIVADDIEFGFENKIPLWLFGFLY